LPVQQACFLLLIAAELIAQRLDQAQRARVIASGQGAAYLLNGGRLRRWQLRKCGDGQERQRRRARPLRGRRLSRLRGHLCGLRRPERGRRAGWRRRGCWLRADGWLRAADAFCGGCWLRAGCALRGGCWQRAVGCLRGGGCWLRANGTLRGTIWLRSGCWLRAGCALRGGCWLRAVGCLRGGGGCCDGSWRRGLRRRAHLTGRRAEQPHDGYNRSGAAAGGRSDHRDWTRF